MTLCSCKSTEIDLKRVYYLREQLYNHCGDDNVEDPPVPIPNTEVKLNRAESTWLDTAREDRELPHFILQKTRFYRVFLLYKNIRNYNYVIFYLFFLINIYIKYYK